MHESHYYQAWSASWIKVLLQMPVKNKQLFSSYYGLPLRANSSVFFVVQVAMKVHKTMIQNIREYYIYFQQVNSEQTTSFVKETEALFRFSGPETASDNISLSPFQPKLNYITFCPCDTLSLGQVVRINLPNRHRDSK